MNKTINWASCLRLEFATVSQSIIPQNWATISSFCGSRSSFFAWADDNNGAFWPPCPWGGPPLRSTPFISSTWPITN